MHKIIQQLIEDHKHLLLLLKYLEKEIAFYELNSSDLPDLAMILDIFDYIQVYPEKWHHPLEEQLFSILLNKPIKEHNLVNTVKLQHDELEISTTKLVNQFNAIANDQVIPITQVLIDTKQYLQYQREHIDVENQYIFPLIMKHIEGYELSLVDQRLILLNDPLFGANLRKSYQILYEEVVKMEEEGYLEPDLIF